MNAAATSKNILINGEEKSKNCHPYYSCINSQNPLALCFDLLSKGFKAKSGPAYLFSHARNIAEGTSKEEKLNTGVHTIADISCSNCGEELGWKYVQAYDIKQKYKGGKFIIERAKMAD